MRRVLLTLAALVLCLGVASQASANIFNNPGTYQLKFDGYEYAYWGTHSDFLNGTAGMISGQAGLLGPDYQLNTGFNMSAVTYLTTVNKMDANGHPIYPETYSSGDGGVYLAVLRDLQASLSTGYLNQGNAMMYFTGGVLDWYFIPSATISHFSNMVYTAGVGLGDAVGQLMDKLAGLDPFAQFTLSETIEIGGQKYTGSAKISLENDEYVMGDAKFFADAIDGSLFDSDMFNGHDMAFQATLYWNELLGRFRVDDPASVNVPTPEPGTLSLMALGLLLTAFNVRRRKNMG